MTLRLAVVTTDPDGPVARHRVRALVPHLADAGFAATQWHPLPRRLRDRFALFRSLRDADVVLLLRKLFTAAELRLLRRAARCLVYDVDDAVMYRDPFRGRSRSHVRARRFAKTVRAADLVTAGNAYLVDHARGAAPEAHVGLAPTPVDTVRFSPGGERRPGSRLGWIGSRSTRPYLRLVDDALARLAAHREDLTLAVMADAPPTAPDGVRVEFHPWSEAAEVPFLRSLDVGLMPLSDDPWSRGKCGFKLLQYMACGVPAVASPVGVNSEICDGGRAGLLADDADAWIERIGALLDDRDRAAELGAAGRARVESEYSTDVLGPRYAAALAACAAGVLR